MSSTRPDPLPRRLAAALAAVLLVVGGALVGCSLPGAEAPAPDDSASSGDEVAPALQQVLDRRARALRDGDLEAFLTTVAPGRERFRAVEKRYFTNLAQLPVGRLHHRLDPDSVVADGEGYRAVVQTSLQLEGFDAHPVVRPARFRFVPDRAGDGYVVADDRDRGWERRQGIGVQPWDNGRIVVRHGRGVLGVFDEASAAHAGAIIAAVEAGIDAVSATVPLDWSRSVVVYALSDTSMLAGLDNLPGDDPDRLDGVAFPVMRTPTGDELASTRFLLHPRMLTYDAAARARLVRHELTHVAVGSRDDGAPTWLSEGIAEWVSVQPMPQDQRSISAAALAAARSGLTDLPADTTFNGTTSSANYGISWWACEAVVDLYGDAALWSLLDSLAAADPDQRERVLQRELGLGERQLAEAAAQRIVATYDF